MGKAEPRWNPNYGQRYQRALRKMSPFICQVSFIVSVESVFYGECTWHPVWCCPRYFDADGWMPIKDIAPIISQVPDYTCLFSIRQILPNLNFSALTQWGMMWKFILQSRKPEPSFQTFRNVVRLDLSSCDLNGEFRLRRVLHPSFPWLAFDM